MLRCLKSLLAFKIFDFIYVFSFLMKAIITPGTRSFLCADLLLKKRYQC